MTHTEKPRVRVLHNLSAHLQLLDHHIYLLLAKLLMILLLQQVRYRWKGMWVTIIMRKQIHLYAFP